jgi:succinyl-CoA synthetase beta subunit
MADYRTTRERFLASSAAAPSPNANRKLVSEALTTRGPTLTEWEAQPILAAYRIGGKAPTLAKSAAEAEAAAVAIGKPVALKVQSPDILHKTEAGAVALNVTTPATVSAAYQRVLASAKRHVPHAQIQGVLVQPMAPPGREVILGIKRDEQWGPMLMVGLGGVLVEALNDVALAPVPLGHGDALALLRRLKGARLFEAFRGSPAADIDALADLMVKLSQFAADHADDIAEIDLNPVLVHPEGQGVSVVDALIVKTSTATT